MKTEIFPLGAGRVNVSLDQQVRKNTSDTLVGRLTYTRTVSRVVGPERPLPIDGGSRGRMREMYNFR